MDNFATDASDSTWFIRICQFMTNIKDTAEKSAGHGYGMGVDKEADTRYTWKSAIKVVSFSWLEPSKISGF